MKAKHTPGPWTAERMLIPPKAKDRRCGFVINGPDPAGQDLPPRICDLRVPRGTQGFSEGRANARLIAAAPDLLEALKEYDDVANEPNGHEGGWEAALTRVSDKARAAIRKATGVDHD